MKKNITEIGIVIVASSNLKRIAGMDNAVKTFEEMKNFLKPLMAYLTVPILIIGLKEPETFTIEHFQNPTVTGTKKLLGVVKYNNGNYNIIPSEVEMWQNANSLNDRYFNYSDIQSQL